MASIYEVKKGLDQVYGLLDVVEDGGGKPKGMDISLKKAFQTELHTFLMYLAASDGHISREEKEFMNELFDADISTQDYADFINANEIYSTKFEESLPLTLKVTTAFDKKMQIAASVVGQSIDMITPIILKFYAGLGEMFIEIDGATENEKNDLKIILNNFMAKIRVGLGLKEEVSLGEEDEDAVIVGGKKRNN